MQEGRAVEPSDWYLPLFLGSRFRSPAGEVLLHRQQLVLDF